MKILVVLPRFPYPLEKGDKLRAYHQIRTLSKNNEIYLFCVSHQKVLPEHIKAVKPFCKEIYVCRPCKLVGYKNVVRNFIYSKSLQIGYWDSRKARRAFNEFDAKVDPDVIYSQMVRTMTLVSHSANPKVMDFQDALSMNTERRMEQSRGLKHFAFHYEFKMLRSSEYNSFSIFDDLTIISEPDSEAIPHKKNGLIKIVPNGVDFEHFHPIEKEKDYDLVFCGNMQYPPNVDAAQYLVNDIMPYVWKVMPNARVMLAGATPVAAVRKLASDKVTVTGSVEDIRDCYARARVFAAPMKIGSGLQNKLLEAMAMQLPCVTTSLANDALCAEAGKQVLIGDKAEDFADHIIDLLQSEEERNALAMNGYNYVHENFSWEAFGEKLENILLKASSKHL